MEESVFEVDSKGRIAHKKFSKTERRNVWFWFSLQIIANGAWLLLVWIFKIKSLGVTLGQWATIFCIWYLQIYFANVSGFDILLSEDTFRRWDIIQAGRSSSFALVYKHPERMESGVRYRIFPFTPYRRRWKNYIIFFAIKGMVKIRLIK